jgi:hypothetical protein
VRWQEVTGPGEVEVVLRHGPDDDAAASQVRRALRVAIPVAERWGTLAAPLYITIHATHEALETAARRPDHPWLRAWARVDSIEFQSPRTWTRGEATDEEVAQILAHELTHCAMFQAIGGDARLGRSIPAWFREGMATSNSGERFLGVSASPATGDALTVTALLYQTDSSGAYATADQAFRFLVHRYGENRIRGVLTRMGSGAPFASAFQEATGISVEAFEAEFRGSAHQETNHG